MGPKGNQTSKGGLDARRAEWGGYGNGLSFNFDKKKQNGALWSVNQAVSLVMYTSLLVMDPEAKEKYRGVFEIQKTGDKTSSGEISLDISYK